MNGSSAGLGDSFSDASSIGAQSDRVESYTSADGRAIVTYNYPGMEISTTDGVVSCIDISSEEASTSAGLRPGMTLSEMESIYGTGYSIHGDVQYVYTEGNVTLTVLVIDDEVLKIEICDNSRF